MQYCLLDIKFSFSFNFIFISFLLNGPNLNVYIWYNSILNKHKIINIKNHKKSYKLRATIFDLAWHELGTFFLKQPRHYLPIEDDYLVETLAI